MARAPRVAALAAVLAVLVLPACASSEPEVGSSAPGVASDATRTPSPLPEPSPPALAPPAASTAQDALAAFLEAARAADVALRQAATHIDGAVRVDAVVLDEATTAAVQAVDLAAVREAIPAGLPTSVLLPVLVAYGDLSSRHAAMAYAGVAARTWPRPGTEADELLSCLANGSPAAASFEGDLEAVRVAAASTPPPEAVAPDAPAGAELAARLEEIDLRNLGCGACGGHVPTALSEVVWDDPAPGATVLTGTVAGVGVEATYTPGGGWSAVLIAC